MNLNVHKNKIIITALIVIIALCTFYALDSQQNIEKNYFSKIGIEGFEYKHVIQSMGSPLSEKKEINLKTGAESGKFSYYKGYTLYFGLRSNANSNPYYFLDNISITDPDYKIGKQEIGIGSTQQEVEKVYENVKRVKDKEDAFIDRDTWIEFDYNDNQKVKAMQIYYGP
ncbi:hypothetical protein [Paenibacillus dauci]|uniref:hypothetical protein n=1 Tax=Paenibacillus dauci TaxID=1567106 RepID=UPI000619B2FF|nr:hypothetical protein [Paenibacillus dauci]